MAAHVTHIPPVPRRGISVLSAVALVLLSAALTALAVGFGSGVRVAVDGSDHSVPTGATIADLAAARYTTARAGTLYNVNGGIIGHNSGDPVSYVRNGVPVSDTQRVYEGDVVVSRPGADRMERTVLATVSVDPTATIEGTGPILKVVRQGNAGLSVVRKGAISGYVVSSRVIVPAEHIVLMRSMPTSADKVVALTFDDGPWPKQTEQILSILKANGVRATFFELGSQVRRNPQISRAVVAAGSVVANHSWNHPFMTRMRAPQVRRQIADTAAVIKSATGKAPTLFRPPYGAINNTVWAQAKANRESVVLWDVDTLDWTKPGPAKILSNAENEMGRASIVLMHDGGGDRSQTIAALPKLIQWLKGQGYTFLTVDELQAAR